MLRLATTFFVLVMAGCGGPMRLTDNGHEMRAKQAIDDVFADTSLSVAKRRERLSEIREEIDMKLEVLPQ